MADTTLAVLTSAIRQAAHPLTGAETDYDPLMELIGDARFVLLGEARQGRQRKRTRLRYEVMSLTFFHSSPHSGEL
jgi:erythromycin esterase-like protein